ncbi:sensor histidine kinase [Naasia lichenicola]|uniref:histidine kinase n=1 Tax=Naasia lichenicola TaxID=2565933 RepID=A0A4V3WSU1_9MICO|nr:ATP-binding protein [Naasia lichenicola]THG29417.1 hypothetical protein E6C64_11955 [Naasia lichenicola]
MTAVPLEEALERRAAADAIRSAVATWSIVMLSITFAIAASVTAVAGLSYVALALASVALIASPCVLLLRRVRSPSIRLIIGLLSVIGLIGFVSGTQSFNGAGEAQPDYIITLASAAFVTINGSVTWRAVPLLAIPVLYALTVFIPLVFVVWPNDVPWRFDLFTAIAAVTLLVVVVVVRASRQRSQAAFDAVTEVRLQVEQGAHRSQLESRASAIVHDTVLNELAVLATTPPGPLRPEVRRQLQSSLSHLSREDWLLGPAPSDEATHGGLDDLIDRCRARGLEVSVSGERGLLTALSGPVVAELLRAVEQCLTNVLKHSGETTAEVVVLGSADEVSVMVIDDGVGFVEPTDPGDRIGLRASVKTRLEELGGSAQIWSTPGAGTSVVLTVPGEPAR